MTVSIGGVVFKIENADDEIRLCEQYALVISKINDSLKVLNNLSE